MKRTLSILSFTGLLCLCLFALTPSASAAEVVDSGYCGGEGDGTNLTWTLTDDGVLTIQGNGKMEDNGYSQWTPWYDVHTQIIDIHLMPGVTSIGGDAFHDCINLTTVSIPDSVSSIGIEAFADCTSLNSVVIPNSVTSIDAWSFSACSSLTDISLPTSLTFIGEFAFYECSGLHSVVIPQSVTFIGEQAFSNCKNLSLVFAEGNAPADCNNAFDMIPLIYSNNLMPWTEEWGAIPGAWDGTVFSSAVSLDLIDGSIALCEVDGVTYCLQAGIAQATTGGVLIRQTDSGSTSTNNKIFVTGGNCKATISDLNMSRLSSIDIDAKASLDLLLLGKNYTRDIILSDEATLAIDGSGSLMADNILCNGTIVIDGGAVEADVLCGKAITINGGAVRVHNRIGGDAYTIDSTIIVNGGTVTTYHIGGDHGGVIAINGGIIAASKIGAGSGGTFDAITISENATLIGNPTIKETIFMDTQPMTTAAHNGNTPVLSVAAHNHSGISYQWQVSSDSSSWTNLEGQTSAQTTFPMSADLNGKYVRCQLTNGWGNVLYTDVVQVWILAFSQQPVSVEANLNDLVAFNAASTCSNVTYQWQRSYDDGQSWVDVPGETYGTLAVNATLSESSAKYRCVITATNGDQLASDMVEIKLDAGALVTYTARYYQQNPDGQGYTLVNQQVLEGISGQNVTIPEASYEGFTENTQAGPLTGTVTGDSGLVLARYYDRNTYQITFQMNGGSVLPPLEARYGADITPPSNPSRFAYTFAGWYADEALTEEYTFTTMPLGGTTVYAKWTPVGADRGIEYQINGLAVRDISTFEFLDAIPDGKFLVEVSVTNLKATATDTILLVQYTDQGQMLGMQYLYASTQAGQTVTFGASVDNTDGKIGKIKAMILPSLGSPVPLANAVEMM